MAFNLENILRKDLENLVPYEAKRPSGGLIKLDANENPFDFPSFLMKEIWNQFNKKPVTRYPDPLATELREALSDFTGIPRTSIVVGNGSDELILNLILAFGSGGQVIIATPTFSMYRVHSLVAGAVPVEIPRKEDFTLDLPALCDVASRNGARLVFLCSPNNPTGNATPVKEIETILKHSRALVVVDEAYIDFGGESCLDLLDMYPNLVLLRTFSKAYGLAGLRIGYLLSSKDVVKQLLQVKQPFNLNTFSQIAARVVLAHQEVFRQLINKILSYRDYLISELKTLPGFTVFPAEANFVLFCPKISSNRIFDCLLKEGVLIRKIQEKGVEGCLRVTVGQEEENKVFMEKLKYILKFNL